MTTSTTPTSQYANTFNNQININQNNSYANYLCSVYNQRVSIETASTTTTSTTFANLTTNTVSSCSATDILLPTKVQMLDALPSIKPDLSLTDTGLFTVYHFIKNFIG